MQPGEEDGGSESERKLRERSEHEEERRETKELHAKGEVREGFDATSDGARQSHDVMIKDGSLGEGIDSGE